MEARVQNSGYYEIIIITKFVDKKTDAAKHNTYGNC